MERQSTQHQINQTVHEEPMVLVYFTGSSCAACEVIKTKVEQMLEAYPLVKGVELNGVQYPEVAAAYGVLTLPIFIVFVEGKEAFREGRNLDLLDVERKIARYVALMQG